ncbi:hypothetical protein [Cupriavidus basilensis]|uniref:Uncharacterized protein n=1 Tax=Cupriavidus basilensis TaxID=68895 RepID=A0A643G8L9_9BURK|nr:hypothetical protein [Cupriavidus basilensis]QOT75083.1 hypothetical protein F7R26_012605 [Cupriavidus basilensis]
MSAHTPGPWHRNIKPASKYNVVFAGRNTHVAAVKTQGMSEAEIEANMDLIVAAPDMLALFRKMLAEYEDHPTIGMNLWENDLRAVIAQATGGAA